MVRRKKAIVGVVIATSLAIACKPDLNQRTFLVTSPRVLAVQATPAEGAPGDAVTFSTLFVDENGSVAGPFDWAFCEDRAPLSELGPVSSRCARRSGDFFLELGASASIDASLPRDACNHFGPDVPPPLPNQPPGRPVDPDSTGGFYQPVRLAAGDDVAVERVRITCGVAGATPDQLAALKQRYHANTNPSIDSLADATLGVLVTDDQGTTSVHTSARLALRATWADCDPSAAACTGSEGYAAFDLVSHGVVDHREEMRVSWFATGGTFDEDRTGRDANDTTPFTENAWTAPSSPGPVRMWVVVRDDRGGAGWRSYVLNVD